MDFRQRVAAHLAFLYPGEPVTPLVDRALSSFGLSAMDGLSGETLSEEAMSSPDLWSERDAILITYADTITSPDEAPLRVLKRWLGEHLAGAMSTVHVLPFFPWSSDDGFSVIDLAAVDPSLGEWGDVSALASDFGLMSDLVLNHVSVESEWFQQFQRGEAPGVDFFIELAATADVSAVTRPRTHPLMRPTPTVGGLRQVWCTFSHDQVDLDTSNPDVLNALLAVIRLHIEHGATALRLDAVAYLWKRMGTSCIHLPETHEVVRLIRTLLDERARRGGERPTLVVTETNVPTVENLSYFGDGDEAHVVYNFALPPLLLHACLTGDTVPLAQWATSMPDPPLSCTYLNFFASHDGIGLRPAENLLDEQAIAGLVNAAAEVGGGHSDYQSSTGPRPYELNASLVDLLRTDGEVPVARLLAAHSVVLALAGIPAIYIHSLLGTSRDHDRVKASGRLRAINRAQIPLASLTDCLADANSFEHAAFHGLRHLLTVRQRHPAFSPNAAQEVLRLPDGLFGVLRSIPGNKHESDVIAVANLADHEVTASAAACRVVGRWSEVSSQVATGVTEYRADDMLSFEPYSYRWMVSV